MTDGYCVFSKQVEPEPSDLLGECAACLRCPAANAVLPTACARREKSISWTTGGHHATPLLL